MNETEKLLAEVIEQMAERFENQAVLRGGMVLRVLGCERLTNDVDYLMIPFRSKKDVVEDVLETLGKLRDVEVTHSLNSKCLRVILKRQGTVAQVEIKVAEKAPLRVLSTRELSNPLGIPPRLIPVLDFPAALADKLAAWNERRLIRDLYDIWFFLRMGIRPDPERLRMRLLKPEYSRRVPAAKRLPDPSVEALVNMLHAEILSLSDADIAEELRDYLPESEFAGLSDRFRAEIVKAFG
jgi:predicted nucleotidyltransferase component of viral defense system